MKQMQDYLETKAQLTILQMDKKKLIDEATPPIPAEVAIRIEEINAEFSDKEQAAQQKLSELEKEIKDAVIAAGGTKAVDGMKAIYNKGRASWDTKSLDAVMGVNAELNALLAQYKKTGAPYVSFRFE